MQNTRLNNLFNVISLRIRQWFANPWRRLSLILIGLLLGVFLGTAISTTAGQAADWDIVAAGMLVIFTETVSRTVYSRRRQTPLPEPPSRFAWLAELLNALKIGLTYSLFIEAFKLGS